MSAKITANRILKSVLVLLIVFVSEIFYRKYLTKEKRVEQALNM